MRKVYEIKDENLIEILRNFLKAPYHKIKYEIENSLDWLPKCKSSYDLILIDGDHNYQTVYEELKHMDRLLNPNGIIICDDYQNSKSSDQDLYYSTRKTLWVK